MLGQLFQFGAKSIMSGFKGEAMMLGIMMRSPHRRKMAAISALLLVIGIGLIIAR